MTREIPETYDTLKKAVQYATRMHAGQKRKNSKREDYIVHPVEVMWILFDHGITDETTLISAVLHDVVEDTPGTLEDITSIFGADVANVVDEVTDDKSLPKATRKRLQRERIGTRSLSARLVKIGDKLSNTKDLLTDPPEGWSEKRAMEYIRWSYNICRDAVLSGGVPSSLCNTIQEHFANLLNSILES